MPPMLILSKDLCATKKATNVLKREYLASNVSSIISNKFLISVRARGAPHS